MPELHDMLGQPLRIEGLLKPGHVSNRAGISSALYTVENTKGKLDNRVKLTCATCDNPDPLKSAIAQRWADAPLKPPEKS